MKFAGNYMRDVFLALLLAMLSVSQPVAAGSLVEEQLSTLKEITVMVVVPRFEPIPGLTPDALQKMLRARAVSIVTRHDLEVSESSHQNLVITVDATYQRAGEKQKIMAIFWCFLNSESRVFYFVSGGRVASGVFCYKLEGISNRSGLLR